MTTAQKKKLLKVKYLSLYWERLFIGLLVRGLSASFHVCRCLAENPCLQTGQWRLLFQGIRQQLRHFLKLVYQPTTDPAQLQVV
jgi:hypothetical protein